MQTNKRTKKQPVSGSTMWHNPTPGRVTLKIGNGAAVVFEAGDTKPVPNGTNVSRKAPQLEPVVAESVTTEPEAKATRKRKPRKTKNKLPADLPPVPDRLDDAGKDTGRTPAEATEKFARELAADTKESELRQMAKDSGLDDSGELLDVARRIAVDAVG